MPLCLVCITDHFRSCLSHPPIGHPHYNNQSALSKNKSDPVTALPKIHQSITETTKTKASQSGSKALHYLFTTMILPSHFPFSHFYSLCSNKLGSCINFQTHSYRRTFVLFSVERLFPQICTGPLPWLPSDLWADATLWACSSLTTCGKHTCMPHTPCLPHLPLFFSITRVAIWQYIALYICICICLLSVSPWQSLSYIRADTSSILFANVTTAGRRTPGTQATINNYWLNETKQICEWVYSMHKLFLRMHFFQI